MGIGFGVFLIVIGGIFSFTTLDNSLLKTHLDAVGYILMIGGLLALIMGTFENRQRANKRRNIEESTVQDDVQVRDDDVQDDVQDVHEVRDDRRDV